MGRAVRIDRMQREALGRRLRDAREEVGWSQEKLADVAQDKLDELPEQPPDVVISRHVVQSLEGFPANPLGTAESRAKLLGIVLALRLDKAEINRMAGGL